MPSPLSIFCAIGSECRVFCYVKSILKILVKSMSFVTITTCIRVVEPNLYIGTESGDCMLVELQKVTRGQDHINVVPRSSLERYIHRGPVQALIAAYSTMGCHGYNIPWNTGEKKLEKELDDLEKGDEELDNDLCILVHLV